MQFCNVSSIQFIIMKIKNVEKSSTVDYPPYISAVVFLSGCNFRCPFCYNKELVDENSNLPDIPMDEFIEWLKTRHGKLDAVVITGGEPTIHGQKLVDFCSIIKSLGFKIKLDTNGSNPELVKFLINEGFIDYIAMDIKSDAMHYDKACGIKVSMYDILQSINIIMSSGLPYEFRTTIVPGLHDDNTIKGIASMIKGSPKYAIQQFKPINTLDPEYIKIVPFSESEMEKFKKDFEYLTGIMEMEFRR
jgi:pyruvate formate lyase activating enzyme